MDNSVRDLAVWYPLVPGVSDTSVPDIAKKILDMKIYVRLYAEDFVQQANGMNIDMLDAWLVSVGNGSAEVSVSRTGASPVVCTLTAYTGRDQQPAAGESYIVLSESASMSGGPYRVHPDCFVFMQDAPAIQLMDRGSVNSSDGRPTQQGGRTNGANGDPTPVASSSLSFEDGYNVMVSFMDGVIEFDGLGGYGKGVYDTPPYSDNVKYNTKPGKGLRSINGATGDVSIEAGSILNISGATANDTTTITLKPTSVAAGDEA